MRPNPPRAPGPPRGLEAESARVKGGRRARRPRCSARGRAAPGCAGMSGGAGWGRPALFPAGWRRLRLRWRRLQAVGLRHFRLHPGGLRARRRRQLRREGRWGLRSPAPEPGLAAGRSARRHPPTPTPASFGGGRLCSGLSEEGAWRACGGGWRREGGRRRSDPVGLARLALWRLFIPSFLSPSLPLVSAALGRIYRSQ